MSKKWSYLILGGVIILIVTPIGLYYTQNSPTAWANVLMLGATAIVVVLYAESARQTAIATRSMARIHALTGTADLLRKTLLLVQDPIALWSQGNTGCPPEQHDWLKLVIKNEGNCNAIGITAEAEWNMAENEDRRKWRKPILHAQSPTRREGEELRHPTPPPPNAEGWLRLGWFDTHHVHWTHRIRVFQHHDGSWHSDWQKGPELHAHYIEHIIE